MRKCINSNYIWLFDIFLNIYILWFIYSNIVWLIPIPYFNELYPESGSRREKLELNTKW